ncbi:MAG: DUF6512 family protein [Eubacteriales bacterium]|nr:DUF6512 family protein [Eubacteriales bacterium]
MNKKKWEIGGIIFTIIVGVLLHFTYDWSQGNAIVGIFSPVNESTWEHLKLLFMPFLLWAGIEYVVFGKDIKNFIPAKTISVIAGMTFIVLAFYGYMAIFNRDLLALDISIFIASVLLSYAISYFIIGSSYYTTTDAVFYSKLVLILLFIAFAGFSFNAPNGELFRDPTV